MSSSESKSGKLKSANSKNGEISTWLGDCSAAWDRFWFQPRDPFVLGIMRVLVGLIVFYTHLVWSLELSTFLGNGGMLPEAYRELVWGNPFAWSHLDLIAGQPFVMSVVHLVGLVVVVLFTLGLWTRWTSILTALLVISYANRATGALFGLDQINAFLCMYLAIGNSGAAFSIDRWLAIRKSDPDKDDLAEGIVKADTLTNISTRLIQVHMCVVYLFAAIGKLGGETWFNGEAIWGALASYEYQTIDMTWLAGHMGLVAILTITALTWELVYAALIWPRLTRPIILAMAIPIHLGIGMCMGMMTFGLIMLVGNIAFIESRWLRAMIYKT